MVWLSAMAPAPDTKSANQESQDERFNFELRTPHPALAVLAAAISLLALAPSASHAAKANFGADLSSPVSPVASPKSCPAQPGNGCTRVPVYYDSPPTPAWSRSRRTTA